MNSLAPFRAVGRRCVSVAKGLVGSVRAQARASERCFSAAAQEAGQKTEGTGGGRNLAAIAGVAVFAGAGYALWRRDQSATSTEVNQELGGAHLVNWSGTHEVTPQRLYQPETLEELERIVAEAHNEGRKIRAVGSGLSPNGIAFSEQCMISMGLLDKVLSVDEGAGRVTVQAGARVQDVVEALRPHGLTLQNFASIREQQIGGFTQVGAHGTGAAIPPVDEQVVSMKLVTPGQGTVELSESVNPELFRLARCGLGALGVVAEVTLQCVPAHRLVETTWVSSMAEVKKKHASWLRENQHLRYMWIPYTDTVVVVANNRADKAARSSWLPAWLGGAAATPKVAPSDLPEEEKTAEMRALLQDMKMEMSTKELMKQTAFQLRDELVARDPMNPEWIARVNRAEAEYWKLSTGVREGWSDEMLGFDCGGQQWVLEVAFPTGTLRSPSFADLAYMEQLLEKIEAHQIPAPAPIEQRWTSASSSPMSPAYSADPEALFSWVGVIMYLPPDDLQQRAEITSRFHDYTDLVYTYLVPQYGASEHWAKIELPHSYDDRELMQNRLKGRYPVSDFNAARKIFDPKNIMANDIVDKLFPMP
uniref:L-galactono-1,4-lactone dehydorogenase n=1 Tax=Tetraselmis sp. GSL018 TaxID=582737 RepID=A0A061QTN3_9CHLO|eukprot:CAMPEP_0177617654 /NCGR_PEP_ID=MMETSP0419_2-20121207/25050_1 /TAXON_ID=582737 /ORGANISM="Tetraselmis sp., Strain GSL018" /LENGTH=590 /DNA_ID=CAMNT_0019116285 /DNA_START=80 /DNA_END=1852 /DNA_ORIENTATION=+